MFSIIWLIKAQQRSDCYAALLSAANSYTRLPSVLTLRASRDLSLQSSVFATLILSDHSLSLSVTLIRFPSRQSWGRYFHSHPTNLVCVCSDHFFISGQSPASLTPRLEINRIWMDLFPRLLFSVTVSWLHISIFQNVPYFSICLDHSITS